MSTVTLSVENSQNWRSKSRHLQDLLAQTGIENAEMLVKVTWNKQLVFSFTTNTTLPIICIYIFTTSNMVTCKDMTILCQHVSTVAQNGVSWSYLDITAGVRKMWDQVGRQKTGSNIGASQMEFADKRKRFAESVEVACFLQDISCHVIILQI